MIRLITVLSLLLSVPGPSAWAAVVEFRLGAAASAPSGAVGRLPVILPLSASWTAPSFSPSVAPLGTGVVPAAAPTFAAPALAAPALSAAPAAAALPAKASALVPSAAAARPAAPAASETSSSGAESREADLDASAAAVLFDGGAATRVHLTGLGRAPVSIPLSQLGAALAADPAYRAALLRSGKVRAVLSRDADKKAAAASLAGSLKALGIDAKVEVETLAPSRPAPARTAAVSVEEVPERKTGELAFLARQFRASMTRPSRTETLGGLLTRAPFIAINVLAFAPLYLPHHPYAFAAIAGLTIGLKTFHSFWVDGWAAFQNRLVRLRGIPYLTAFNLVYGQIVAAVYRVISWTALPGIIPPWTLAYWRDMGIVTLAGTFIGTLASQGVNELYEKGLLSRHGRSFFLLARALILDADGYFFKTGLMGSFWIVFTVHQALDLILYMVSARAKPRAVLYLASEEISRSAEFAALYPSTTASAARESGLRRALEAVRKNPIAALLARPFRRESKVPPLAAAYRRALADPSLTDEAVLSRIGRVTPALDAHGAPVPATREGGISVPVLAADAEGRQMVFKPIRMSPADALYPYERMKLLREVAGSAIMRRFGVPTVDYRLARGVIDGRETLGIVSPFLTLRHPAAGSDEEERLAGSDAFARGSVVDAWMGNTDRITNRGNLWISGEAGETGVIFGDFDQAFRAGVAVLGVPKMPLAFHARFSASAAAARAVAEIAALDDAAVRRLAAESLAGTDGFGAGAADYLGRVLIENRDALRRGALGEGAGGFRLSADAADALADAVLADKTRPIGSAEQLDAALDGVVSLWTHPELKEPTRDILRRAVDNRLAGRREAVEPPAGRMDLLQPLMNFIYMKVSPEAAIAGGIGYYP